MTGDRPAAPIDYQALAADLGVLLGDTVTAAHGDQGDTKPGRLDMVAVAAAAHDCCRRQLVDAVHAARAGDASWAEIGNVLGVSRQAVFQRFGP
jgi:hypothetical protein